MKALLARLDALWTRVELVVACGAAGALLLSLSAWVVLKGLAAQTTSSFFAGALLRAGVLGVVAAWVTFRVTKGQRLATAAVGAAGALVGVLLRDVGVSWAGNILGWVQDGSSLTLVGGLRGLATRLTLLLVFVGASIATAQGRHLTIDVVARLLPETARRFTNVLTGLVAAAVCVVSAWGFFDFIAIDAFRARMDDVPAAKWSAVSQGLGRDAFFLRRQLALDLTVGPRVVTGATWDTALTGAEWNAWLDAVDWSNATEFSALRENRERPEATHVPLVVTSPDSPRGLLVKPLSLVVPLGLLALALRFLLWVLRGAPAEGAHGAAT
ncbi:MAG: TRAP transporter small permease subunit [Myxococcales bacterium]|nr:TRAP transporter small permease subunit [Myxococcales bacterium]